MRNLVILSFTLVIVSLGFGLVVPIMPFIIQKLGAGGSEYGLLVALSALTELVFGPFWGGLSDRVGRKPILMVGVFGYAVTLVFFGLATELWMLYVARALSGVLSAAAMSTAMAYVGDSTGAKERGGGMGALGGSAGLGVILGPGVGGWLAVYSLTLPFLAGAALALVALLLVAVFLPETLPRQARASSRRQLSLVDVRGLWRAAHGPLGGLLLLATIGTIGTSNFESIFSLYGADRLGYSPEQVGLVLTVVGIVAVIGRGLLTGLATRRWGEPHVIRAALLAASGAFVLLLLAQTFWAVVVTCGLFVCITAFFRPAVHSLTSQRSSIGQGTTMGLSNSFVNLGRVLGSLWAGTAYDLDQRLPYLSGIIILLLAFALSFLWLRPDPGSSQPTAPSPTGPVVHR